jgi:hypothetical protein
MTTPAHYQVVAVQDWCGTQESWSGWSEQLTHGGAEARAPRYPICARGWAQGMMRQLTADRQAQAAGPEALARPRQVVVRICLRCRCQFQPEALERICPACTPH